MRPPGASFFTSTSGSVDAAAHALGHRNGLSHSQTQAALQLSTAASRDLRTAICASFPPPLLPPSLLSTAASHDLPATVCASSLPPLLPLRRPSQHITHLRPRGWHQRAPPHPAHRPAHCRTAAAGWVGGMVTQAAATVPHQKQIEAQDNGVRTAHGSGRHTAAHLHHAIVQQLGVVLAQVGNGLQAGSARRRNKLSHVAFF